MRIWIAAVLAAVLAAGLASASAIAQSHLSDPEGEVDDAGHDYVGGRPDHPSEAWLVVRGGKLYADWMEALMKKGPEQSHPAYPAGGDQSGAATWRCTACHGWDYGALAGKGPWTEADVTVILRDDRHRYGEDMLPAAEMAALTLFLNKGAADTAPFIDRAAGKSKGAAAQGQPYYETICAACHGYDGRTLGFWDGATLTYLGTEAAQDPAKVFHMARFGHPGEPMVALYLLPPATVADILAFVQTLPTGDR